MIPFAVTIEGVTKEGEARWVLAVSETGVLTAGEDRTLAWYPLEQVRFARIVPPDAPHPVILVQPQGDNIVVPRGGFRNN